MIHSELVLVPLTKRQWRIATPFIVVTVAGGVIKVPAGFICDLSSIPRFLWWESTPTDYPEAGATHDWLYHQQVAKNTADAVYLEVLLGLGMGSFRAHARYYALRLFGGLAYRADGQRRQRQEVG